MTYISPESNYPKQDIVDYQSYECTIRFTGCRDTRYPKERKIALAGVASMQIIGYTFHCSERNYFWSDITYPPFCSSRSRQLGTLRVVDVQFDRKLLRGEIFRWRVWLASEMSGEGRGDERVEGWETKKRDRRCGSHGEDGRMDGCECNCLIGKMAREGDV